MEQGFHITWNTSCAWETRGSKCFPSPKASQTANGNPASRFCRVPQPWAEGRRFRLPDTTTAVLHQAPPPHPLWLRGSYFSLSDPSSPPRAWLLYHSQYSSYCPAPVWDWNKNIYTWRKLGLPSIHMVLTKSKTSQTNLLSFIFNYF